MARSAVIEVVPGVVFGDWTVLRDAPYAENNTVRRVWCRCSCGKEKMIYVNGLRSGASRSCGCKRSEKMRTHGACTAGAKENGFNRLYRVWSSMKERCTTPTHHAYERYGSRGISVCQRWADSFEAFLEDMGPRPDGGTLERIDNDGNYEPSNCKWASHKEQQRNHQRTIRVEWEGSEIALSELCEDHGLSYSNVSARLRRGWSLVDALRLPFRESVRGPDRQTNSKTIEYEGATITVQELSERTGVPYNLLYQRLIVKDWTVERAISTPARVAKIRPRLDQLEQAQL